MEKPPDDVVGWPSPTPSIALSSFVFPPSPTNPQLFHFPYSFIFHYALPICSWAVLFIVGRVLIMSSPSFPNPPPPLPSQPPTALHQNHLHQDHSYTPTIMNPYRYPSNFGFTTASVAIARERAGSRSRPEPRRPRPVQTDDRQSPSVSSIVHQSCHSLFPCIKSFCFLIVDFVHHRLHLSRH